MHAIRTSFLYKVLTTIDSCLQNHFVRHKESDWVCNLRPFCVAERFQLLLRTHHCLSATSAVLIVTCMYSQGAEIIGNSNRSKHRYGRHHIFMKWDSWPGQTLCSVAALQQTQTAIRLFIAMGNLTHSWFPLENSL